MLHRKSTTLMASSLLVVGLIAQACGGAATTAPSAAPSATPAGGASSAPSAAPTLAPAELTLWHNYGTEANAKATEALVAAFEAKNPGVTIKVVSQPADNYFDLLQTAAISKTGPDIATQWTGLFDLKYKDYLEPLNQYIPLDELKKMKGIEYSSINFSPDDGVLVVPLDLQFYNGFYNKDLFAKAGISTFPTTWDELFAVCDKLKAAGITPFTYGTGGQALGGGFYPWYDVSYLMMYLQPSDWKKLYTGEIPWTDATVQSQFDKWGSLFTKGCTNTDVLTNQDSIAQFEAGQAAMTMEGTWQIAEFQEKMGDKVDVFVPPFSDTPIKGIVEYSGDGFSMTTYSKNKPQAAAFLAFMASDEGQQLIAGAGVIPDKEGFSSDQRMAKNLLDFAANQGYTRYPMIDNVIQPEVSDVGTKVLNAAFGGAQSMKDALTSMQQTLDQLPADQKNQIK
ncbi:MAG: extracellular solute-binding protein [Chloroflexi bacterium]|nr:extracellular solute-binding protein [Chloroflexota bacterium]